VGHRAVLGADEVPALLHHRVVLAQRRDRGPHRDDELDAELRQLAHHRRRVGPLRRVELPLAQVRPVEEVADDGVQRQPAPGVLAGDAEELLLGAVAQLALPEAGGPLRQHGGVPGGRRVAPHGLRGPPGRDPVVDLPGAVGHPARAVPGQLHPPDRGVVPQKRVAPVGGQHRDGDLGVALHQVEDGALLVQQAVLVLAEPVQPLALVRREALLQAVVAVAGGGVEAGARPPEVGSLLCQQLRPGVGAQEADQALGVHLGGDRADGEGRQARADLDGDGPGRRRLVQQRPRQPGQHGPAEPRPHPYGVGPPRLDEHRFLAAAPLQRAVPLGEGADGGGRLGQGHGLILVVHVVLYVGVHVTVHVHVAFVSARGWWGCGPGRRPCWSAR
jgi:hypothetical protein